MLRIVVVLYGSRLSAVRPLLAQLRGEPPDADVHVNVVINRDGLTSREGRLKRFRIEPLWLEVRYQHNRYGVAGAYNSVIRSAGPHDILVLLDADSRPGPRYFAELCELRPQLLSSLSFAGLELFSGSLRISPYKLRGTVPCPITESIDHRTALPFAGGIGVINSGLAGSVASFRAVDGFSDRLPLDLSDVAWSIEAARKGATLVLLSMSQSHDLSMRSRGFGMRRLARYLVACWRLAGGAADPAGGLRLALRGLRALRWKGLWS